MIVVLILVKHAVCGKVIGKSDIEMDLHCISYKADLQDSLRLEVE